MKNKPLKIWATVLACVALGLGGTACSVEGVMEYGGTEYGGTAGLSYRRLSDGTYEVGVGLALFEEEIVIPEKYNDKPVSAIAEEGFLAADVEKLTVAKTITSIGAEAFRNCSKMKEVYIEDVEAWCAISGLEHLMEGRSKDMYLQGESLKELTLPGSVRRIPRSAFYGCENLESVTIANGIFSIGTVAFSGCISLRSVSLPNSVISIEEGAFAYCGSLRSVSFVNTSGWSCVNSYSSSGKTVTLKSNDLKNAATAAEYLKSTYSLYVWSCH